MESVRELIIAFRNNRDVGFFLPQVIASDIRLIAVISLGKEIDYPFPQYSSWLIAHVARQQPQKLYKHQPLLVDVFLDFSDESMKRNLLGALLDLPRIKYREGELLDHCFALLIDPNTKVAIKAYAMYMLLIFVEQFPELIPELEAAIEHNGKHQSPAFYGAARKVAKKLVRIKQKSAT